MLASMVGHFGGLRWRTELDSGSITLFSYSDAWRATIVKDCTERDHDAVEAGGR